MRIVYTGVFAAFAIWFGWVIYVAQKQLEPAIAACHAHGGVMVAGRARGLHDTCDLAGKS